jgi:hypothetical protein
LGDIVLNINEYLKLAVEPALDAEISRIQKELPQKEAQYEDIAEDFTIEWDSKDLAFVYRVKGNASAQKAFRLEYGPPARSLIRHEVVTANQNLGKKINQNLNKLLGLPQ